MKFPFFFKKKSLIRDVRLVSSGHQASPTALNCGGSAESASPSTSRGGEEQDSWPPPNPHCMHPYEPCTSILLEIIFECIFPVIMISVVLKNSDRARWALINQYWR